MIVCSVVSGSQNFLLATPKKIFKNLTTLKKSLATHPQPLFLACLIKEKVNFWNIKLWQHFFMKFGDPQLENHWLWVFAFGNMFKNKNWHKALFHILHLLFFLSFLFSTEITVLFNCEKMLLLSLCLIHVTFRLHFTRTFWGTKISQLGF